MPKPTQDRTPIRPEIQALRAIAVGAVVLYHLWPELVPGGFVGVDVFFVISGYLIIGQLLRSFDRTGGVRLADFWARRARRLIPAALVVLAATSVAVVLWAPTVVWRGYATEIAASALYVENWLLAASSVDYLAAENAASPVQHYWSLSVEEQFYIAWPLLVAAVLYLSRRAPARIRGGVLGATLALVTAASFWFSVATVDGGSPAAYFETLGRAWEFGVGGLLAYFAGASGAVGPRARAAASWTGLAMIAAAILAYGPTTAFPGVAALLPVVGTLLVILAGTPVVRWAPSSALSLAPVQWVGGVSYSTYLWHWPPIVLLPFLLGRDLDTPVKVGILVGTLGLAWLTKRFVEDPIRNGVGIRARPPSISIIAAGAASLLVVGMAGATFVAADRNPGATAAAAVTAPECVGARATMDPGTCDRPYRVTSLTDPVAASTDIGRGVKTDDPCKQTFEAEAVISCSFGSSDEAAPVIALVGDSHAAHLVDALDAYGDDHRIRFVTYLKTLCPGLGATGISAAEKAIEYGVETCTDWGRDVLEQIASDERIDGVLFTNYTWQYAEPAESGVGRPAEPDDFLAAWDALGGKPVAVIRDVPRAPVDSIPTCVAGQLEVDDPCAFDRDPAFPATDPMLAAAERAGVPVIDLSDVFCGPDTCHAVIGGLIAYLDFHHLTAEFSRSLAPVLGARIDEAFGLG